MRFNKQDSVISVFGLIAFMLAVPTWWIDQIKDDNLHFLIWDEFLLASHTLVPVMCAYVVKNRTLKIFWSLYAGLTTFNHVDSFINYYGTIPENLMIYKITLASLIAGFLITKVWDKNIG